MRRNPMRGVRSTSTTRRSGYPRGCVDARPPLRVVACEFIGRYVSTRIVRVCAKLAAARGRQVSSANRAIWRLIGIVEQTDELTNGPVI